MIASGNAEVAVAGGVETLSDVPIRYNRAARAHMMSLTVTYTNLLLLYLVSRFLYGKRSHRFFLILPQMQHELNFNSSTGKKFG